MPSIALIDDRKGARDTYVGEFKLTLEEISDKWDVIGIDPFEDINDYFAWIEEEDIAVLIIDERLDEILKGNKRVNYRGHQLISLLREKCKEIPIFLISGFNEQGNEILSIFRETEDIIEKNRLDKKIDDYVHRFVRAGQRYLDAQQEILSELHSLSQKIATNKFHEDDIKRISAIKEKLNIPNSNYDTKIKVIEELEKKIEKWDQLKSDIQQFLNGGNHEMEKG